MPPLSSTTKEPLSKATNSQRLSIDKHNTTGFDTDRSAKPMFRFWRLLLPVFIIAMAAYEPMLKIVISVLADAFFEVSVFVAATLAVYYFVAHILGTSNYAKTASHHSIYGIFIAGALGMLPGCGGAIIVITQYTKGKVSFGAIVAVLTATMGDAAFLLLAQRPYDALLAMAICGFTGVITGFAVNFIHGDKFLQLRQTSAAVSSTCEEPQTDLFFINRLSIKFWQILLIPALLIGALGAFQVDINQFLGVADGSIETVGAVLGFITLALWGLSSKGQNYQQVTSEEQSIFRAGVFQKVAMDTQFVTSWVVVAFLAFELSMYALGIDENTAFLVDGEAAVVLAVLVGLLPGCGPQIMTTGLYLQNLLPFSAQLANAISNDGDALFPAIALAPKAAIIATFYSAIPALIVGYGYMSLFE